MNRTTVSGRAVASMLVAVAGLGFAAVPAVAQEASGSIAGRVWFDRDGDRQQDAGEPGTRGPLDLYRDGALVGTYRADADGRYSMTGLAPGDYRVSNTAGADYAATTPREVDVSVGGAAATADFGMRGGRVSGFVWFDRSGDGFRQDGEDPMPIDQEVRLEGIDAPAMNRTVDDTGHFAFEDLPDRDTYWLFAPNRLTTDGDELTTKSPDSVIDPATGSSAPFAIQNSATVAVGIGYRDARLDIVLDDLTVPQAKVGKPITVVAQLTNLGKVADDCFARLTLPTGVTLTGMSGMTPTDGPGIGGVTTTPLAPGAITTVTFTLTSDRPQSGATVTATVGASTHVNDPHPANNTLSRTLTVTAAPGAAVKVPAIKPVADRRPADAKDTMTPATTENLASTGASPVVPLALATVLVAAGAALVVVMRRRLTKR
jgi:hypothetical protein